MRFLKTKVIASALAGLMTLGIAVSASAEDRVDGLFQRVRQVYDVVGQWHKDGADVDKFVSGAIQGGLEALGDPYTNYYNNEDFADFLESLNGSFSGIGAYLEMDGPYVIVSSPIKGSPAAQAGLASGDRILEAGGVPLVGASTEKAVKLIRGVAGTTVTLKIERPSEKRTLTLTITRAQISIPEIEYKMLDKQVGYIQISSFGDDAVSDFYGAVDKLKAEGAKGLVVDLRQNGGGYLHAAVQIASAFVPKGEPVVWEVGKDGQSSKLSTGRLINMPAAVLVDNGSASASEVLAGAIQDYKAAPLVGVKTFGKGTVQQILTLSSGGGMKVTTAEYLTPRERHVHGIGLMPDYVVENPKPAPDRIAPLEFKRLILPSYAGLDVLYIQYRLQDLGYNTETTGFFGVNTYEAVAKFRKDNHLPGTEVKIDEVFVARLNEQVNAHWKKAKLEDLQLQKAWGLVREKVSK